MLVVYRTSGFSHFVAKTLVRLRWISLVNIVADAEIVPEILQERLTAENLEREGEAILSSPGRAEAMKAGLARVAEALGRRGRARGRPNTCSPRSAEPPA